MAQFIDLYRPSLPAQSRGALAAYKPAAPVIAAIGVATDLSERISSLRFDTLALGSLRSFGIFAHSPSMVKFALASRNKLLPYFAAADAASCLISRNQDAGIKRKTAVAMIGAMLGAFGVKAKDGKDMLAGMMDLIESDEVAHASELWVPLQVNETTLALACRSLVANNTFVPKPTELADACRKARATVVSASRYCDRLCDYVRRCDALLLEFAPEEWREPYSTPAYRKLVLPRLFDMHANSGPTDESFCFSDEYDLDEPTDVEGESECNRNFRAAGGAPGNRSRRCRHSRPGKPTR